MAANDNLWPYNADSAAPAKGIRWGDASTLAFQAKPSVWKKITQEDAQRLRSDPRFHAIFTSLNEETQEIVNALADKRPIAHADQKKPVAKAARSSVKDDLIARIESAISDATDDGDLAGRLKGIELIAKLQSMLNQKTAEDDRVVTINVITGVTRSDP